MESTVSGIDRSALKILVAEDSGLSYALIQALIQRLSGVEPDRAENGREAVEMVRAGDYDLVIMDQMMPDVSGVEATRMIRETVPEWQQPFIAGLSGAATPMDLVRYEASGMNRFIAKPMRLTQLEELLAVATCWMRDKVGYSADNRMSASASQRVLS